MSHDFEDNMFATEEQLNNDIDAIARNLGNADEAERLEDFLMEVDIV